MDNCRENMQRGVQHVETIVDGAIGTIVLNNEKKRNALSKRLIDSLSRH
jgi:enoyl-CoA hydratase/carnithine racemase